MLVRETEQGAYLGPGPELEAVARPVAATPNFDVFDWGSRRLILGKCSRLPDDEDQTIRRYGIDFHRALPPFKGSSGFWCDWGAGPIEVNAYTYARHLPRTLRFREFTANLAFAASTEEVYRAKCEVYQDFYAYLFNSDARIILASPHSGDVRRPPDRYHPFPQSEIDGWTARVMARCQDPVHQGKKRVLVSLHSTDYFGVLLDIGDFGLPQNRALTRIVAQLQEDFSSSLAPLLPYYRDYIIPYTRRRLEWFVKNWSTLDPKRLALKSTAARFEIVNFMKITGQPESWGPIGLSEMDQALHNYWDRPAQQFIALNGVFSGRKTAQLLNLSAKLKQSGIDYAVQVECSRFLARHYPDLAARLIQALIAGLETLP
ncbi:MAG: hypothetical protein P8168_10100 [Deltaproteobacteria bacterium]